MSAEAMKLLLDRIEVWSGGVENIKHALVIVVFAVFMRALAPLLRSNR